MALTDTTLIARTIAFVQKFTSEVCLERVKQSYRSLLNRYCGKSNMLWMKGRFSETCCTYDKLVGALKEFQTTTKGDNVNNGRKEAFEYCYHLFESGFWSMLELFNEGDLTLICAVLFAVDSRVKLKRIDRIVGIAVGGLPLASLIFLGLKNRGIPMSIMSVYPFLQMEPFPGRGERLLVVDSTIQSGFTIRTLADKMGIYLPNVRPKSNRYLVGLSSKTLKSELPLTEPEFYNVWSRVFFLAYCDSEKEIKKIK